MTRARTRRALRHSSTRGRRYMEFFCLTPNGIRVGYASPKLLRRIAPREQSHLRGRAVLALTANPYYALRGVRAGTRLAKVARRLRIGAAYRIGRNTWYLAPNGPSTGVLKVRHRVIQEIGIADRHLTESRRAGGRLLHSFS